MAGQFSNRWKPERNNIVSVLDVPGAWAVWEKSPDRASWWVAPHDDEAKAWCSKHPHALTTGAMSVKQTEIAPRRKGK
jgi:hypothetical protein